MRPDCILIKRHCVLILWAVIRPFERQVDNHTFFYHLLFVLNLLVGDVVHSDTRIMLLPPHLHNSVKFLGLTNNLSLNLKIKSSYKLHRPVWIL